MPLGGAVTTPDLDPAVLGALDDVTLPADTVINSDTGVIAATATIGNFTFTTTTSGAPAGVFRFKSLTIVGALKLEGAPASPRAIALVADGPIIVQGIVDTQACVLGNAVTLAGPGGHAGANRQVSAAGEGAGQTTTSGTEGAGGGGHGGAGGLGGATGGAGGTAFGDNPILLVGGGGGGGGPGGGGGLGGAGGAAVQLVSNTSITINGSINAGGCGGANSGGGGSDGGGGGGAGGLILLEAPTITINGGLAVNGGGGGAGRGTVIGANAAVSRTPAAGGIRGGSGGDGGVGAAANAIDGAPGVTGDRSGGGGGAIGRMRFNTRGGTADVSGTAVLSPSIADATTTTEGMATTQ